MYTAKGLAEINIDWLRAGCWQILKGREWRTICLRDENLYTETSQVEDLDLSIEEVKMAGPPGSPERIAKLAELYSAGVNPFINYNESNNIDIDENWSEDIELEERADYYASRSMQEFQRAFALAEKLYD